MSTNCELNGSCQKPRTSVVIGLCVALTLLIGAFLFTRPQALTARPVGGDAHEYHNLATNLLDRGSYSLETSPPYGPSVFRSPGYPLFLAGVYSFTNQSILAVRILQILLHGLTAWILFLLASALAGRRAALWALALGVCYLPFAYATMLHASETLAILLASLLVYSAVRLREDARSVRWSVIAGLAGGCLALTRPAFGPLVLVPLAIAVFNRETSGWRPRWRSLAVLTGVTVMIVAPWLYYTFQASGKPRMGLSGITLWVAGQQYTGGMSFQCTADDWEVYRQDWSERTKAALTKIDPTSRINPSVQAELVADAEWNQEAKRLLREAGWLTILRRLPAATFWLWSTGSAESQPVIRRLAQAQWLAYVLLVLYGAWLVRAQWRRYWVIWVPAIYVTLIHLLFHIEARYSFPGRALLLVYAGVAVAHLLTRSFQRNSSKPASGGVLPSSIERA